MLTLAKTRAFRTPYRVGILKTLGEELSRSWRVRGCRTVGVVLSLSVGVCLMCLRPPLLYGDPVLPVTILIKMLAAKPDHAPLLIPKAGAYGHKIGAAKPINLIKCIFRSVIK